MKFQKYLFPISLYCVFIISPVLFSFEENQVKSISNSSVVERIDPKDFRKTILAKNLLPSFSLSSDSENPYFKGKQYETDCNGFKIVEYDANRTSIFKQAISDLMEYYISESVEKVEIPGLPAPVGISKIKEEQDSKIQFVKVQEFRPNSNKPPRINEPYRPFLFDNFDTYKGVSVGQNLVRNSHVALQKQSALLPRLISDADRQVNFDLDPIGGENFFTEHYDDYFHFDFKRQFRKDPRKLRAKKVRRTLINYWNTEARFRNKSLGQLRRDLFENPLAVKLTGCKYGFVPGTVSIYYSEYSDLFGVVDESDNTFKLGGIASLCDYVDIYYFKWLNANQTFNQSVKLAFDPSIFERSPIQTVEAEYEEYRESRDTGLPPNYDGKEWWKDQERDLTTLFLDEIGKDSEWYLNLQKEDGKYSETSHYEGFTLLQLEAENSISGVYRPPAKTVPDPNNPNSFITIKPDGRFDYFNRDAIKFCVPTMVDVKCPKDPLAIILSGEKLRTLDQQAEDIVVSIEHQQKNAKGANETVLHVINLFRLRPIDRSHFVNLIVNKAGAKSRKIDFDCVIFLNTSGTSIY